MKKLFSDITEPFVISNADRVICVSENMCKEYIDHYTASERKFIVIPNGYDPKDFDKIDPVRMEEFTVVYAGKFKTSESFRNPRLFFEAIKILNKKGVKLQFVHVGAIESEIVDLAREVGVDSFINYVGLKSYNESLSYMKGANLLVIIGGGQKTEQTGKVFDYLGAKRPILALAPLDGGVATVLQGIQAAKVIDSQDPSKIAIVINEMSKNNYSNDCYVLPKQYERKHLTGVLANVLSEVIP
jgi:glycosyltransferase involved in cell wall biosynthesis